jgi:integrase/recombinase XerC
MRPTLIVLASSFRRHLLAANKSTRTVTTYLAALRALAAFLDRDGLPCDAESIRREHVEAFLVQRMEQYRPASASVEFRALQQFWRWAAEEDETEPSPMAKFRPPIVPEEPPAIISDAQIRRLLEARDGRAFAARRDLAILRLLPDTGMRRAELAGSKVLDVDLCDLTATVLGKGRRPRKVTFGWRTAQALDRYVRVRSIHPAAQCDALWLERAGRMTVSGIYQVVRDRDRAGAHPRDSDRTRRPALERVPVSVRPDGIDPRRDPGRPGSSTTGSAPDALPSTGWGRLRRPRDVGCDPPMEP